MPQRFDHPVRRSEFVERRAVSLPEVLLMLLVPLACVLSLLVAFLAALRGLHGNQRLSAFRIFARALRR